MEGLGGEAWPGNGSWWQVEVAVIHSHPLVPEQPLHHTCPSPKASQGLNCCVSECLGASGCTTSHLAHLQLPDGSVGMPLQSLQCGL
jgi:hypothetical protein